MQHFFHQVLNFFRNTCPPNWLLHPQFASLYSKVSTMNFVKRFFTANPRNNNMTPKQNQTLPEGLLFLLTIQAVLSKIPCASSTAWWHPICGVSRASQTSNTSWFGHTLGQQLGMNDSSATCLLSLAGIWSHLTQTLLPHPGVHSSQQLAMLLVHVRECLRYTRVSLGHGQCRSQSASDGAGSEELGVEDCQDELSPKVELRAYGPSQYETVSQPSNLWIFRMPM